VIVSLETKQFQCSILTLKDDQFRLPFLLETRPHGEFSYDAAKNKLASLRLRDDEVSQRNLIIPGDIRMEDPAFDDTHTPGQQSKLLRLAGSINMESRITVRSLPLDLICLY